MNFDYSLYLVTDRSLSLGRKTVDIVAEAVAGGVTCVQLREKHCSTREFVNEARILHTFLHQLKIPLIINDRIDVALAVGAEGVHLGQSDMKLDDARQILGTDTVIGISVESTADAIEAAANGADYLGVSPIFSTSTKTDTAPPLGLEGLLSIRAAVKLPLVAIGGINQENCASILSSGADGLAVVSAIVSAPSPRDAAQQLRRAAKLPLQG